MNIHAKRGTKIIFANPDLGTKGDQEHAKKHLTVGKTYTVESIDICTWHTNVYLKEISGGYAFNSALFDEV